MTFTKGHSLDFKQQSMYKHPVGTNIKTVYVIKSIHRVQHDIICTINKTFTGFKIDLKKVSIELEEITLRQFKSLTHLK